MGIRRNTLFYGGALLALAGCTSEPAVVASNCEKRGGCVSREALKIDAVDILLVIDDSPSAVRMNRELKTQLPELLNAITSGDAEDVQFPPAKSVHVAVTTTDLGAGENVNVSGCTAWGRDGTFVTPDEFGLTCEVDYPGYLAFEGGPAPVATVDSVGCVPLVTPQDPSEGGRYGCGFEQPLEASLKALAPADSDLEFVHGEGHGTDENAGFLREDSLLVVVAITDEDDCSTRDYSIFDPRSATNQAQGLNLACRNHADRLFDVQRYADALRSLRPDNDNVIFAAIGGLPVELIDDEFRANYDLTTDEGATAYYDAILGDERMTAHTFGSAPNLWISPVCVGPGPMNEPLDAGPSRRLVEAAKAFGARSVIGSICKADTGALVGRLIRAIGQQLSAANAD